MKTKTSTHKRNLLLLIGVVVFSFPLTSWHFSKTNIAKETTLDCSLCDATANGGVVSISENIEGYIDTLDIFCNDAAVILQVSNAILPNDTYQGTFMVTDEDQNIVAYAEGGMNNTALIGSLPAGEYMAWHLVYTNTIFPVLPAIGTSAVALLAAGEENEGCLALSESLEITIGTEIELEFIGFDCDLSSNFTPIIQVTGGCPEINGLGAYNFNITSESWGSNFEVSGLISGIYTPNEGIISSIWSYFGEVAISGDAYEMSISVVADECSCGGDSILILSSTTDCL